MLMGHGFMGGLAGLASIVGLLLQIALVAGLVWLAFRFFRRRSEPALAAAGPASHGRSPLGGPGGPSRSGFPGFGGGSAAGAPARQPVEIGPEDYRAFERALGDIQVSYGRGDIGALRRLATPEMARYLEEDLAEDRRRGVRNEITHTKLLQGDLAEAWREGTAEYATVAMRYEIVETYVDLASGRVVQGNATAPSEVTEIWTFRRDMNGPWVLSAIQQTE
jgi:predicted lipid-binding transport protein (Tim44 family)